VISIDSIYLSIQSPPRTLLPHKVLASLHACETKFNFTSVYVITRLFTIHNPKVSTIVKFYNMI